MMIKQNQDVLKGQHILAQGNPGKTGSRPGLRAKRKIVRVIKNRKEISLFRTKERIPCLVWIDDLSIPSEEQLLLCPTFPRGRFSHVHPYTQGDVSVRSSLNSALGYTYSALTGRA